MTRPSRSESRADMAATVLRAVVRTGDLVAVDDVLLVLESMKMEVPVLAEAAGTVIALPVAAGAVVTEGDLLAVVERAAPPQGSG